MPNDYKALYDHIIKEAQALFNKYEHVQEGIRLARFDEEEDTSDTLEYVEIPLRLYRRDFKHQRTLLNAVTDAGLTHYVPRLEEV